MQQNQRQNIYSVSQLNANVKSVLESSLGTVWLTGEISNLMIPSSGHWYFSLKDQRAQVRCAMFKGQNRRVTFKPDNGSQILVRVNVSLYEPRGEYQLIVQSMQQAGEGALQQAFDALKCKLAAQGIFSHSSKKALPPHPKAVGIISSATGAALQDIIAVLKRRAPALPIIIYPSLVQGDSAASQLIEALKLANVRNEVDVLILARGGGSLEDMWCFNDEALASAIFHSTLPVISAVGHEVDISICDLVADLRAPTPSAAAELVAGDQDQWLDLLQHRQQQLINTITQQLQDKQHRLIVIQHKLALCHPRQQLQQQHQQLDELSIKLNQKYQQLHQIKLHQFKDISAKLKQLTPLHRIQLMRQQVQNLSKRLTQIADTQLQHQYDCLYSLAGQLNTVSPLATFARGYSITLNDAKQVISSVEQVKNKETIHTRLNDGYIQSEVVNSTKLAE